MKDKKLRRYLGFKEYDWGDEEGGDEMKELDRLRDRMSRIEGELFVRNYFYRCPCCKGKEMIERASAKSFKKVDDYNYYGTVYVNKHIVTCYTTKLGYKNHLPAIKEMEKEANKFNK